MKPTIPRFTALEAEAASDAWGFNCGPAALAAIAGLSIDELRPRLGDFEQRGYTNPTMMFGWLTGLGLKWWRRRDKDWPSWGIVRIQFGGPWTRPGVPPAAAYQATHWVGACRWAPTQGEPEQIGVFDVNCLHDHNGWVHVEGWSKGVAPVLAESIRRADGEWWKTHVVEVEPRP